MSKPDYPPVPSPQDTEREAFLAEMAEDPYNWFERDDDYNVWEENQIFLDNEGDY